MSWGEALKSQRRLKVVVVSSCRTGNRGSFRRACLRVWRQRNGVKVTVMCLGKTFNSRSTLLFRDLRQCGSCFYTTWLATEKAFLPNFPQLFHIFYSSRYTRLIADQVTPTLVAVVCMYLVLITPSELLQFYYYAVRPDTVELFNTVTVF